jgi:hypothetical protein
MLSLVLSIGTKLLYASVPAQDGEKWVSVRGKKRMSPALPNLLCSLPQQKATGFPVQDNRKKRMLHEGISERSGEGRKGNLCGRPRYEA